MYKVYIDREEQEKVYRWAWMDEDGVENSVRRDGRKCVIISNYPDDYMTFAAHDLPFLIKALQCAQKAIEDDKAF